MTAPKAHALFAASNSDRWTNCPASILLSQRAPEQKSGAAADEGTRAHELMELVLKAGHKDVFDLEGDGVEITDHFDSEMIRHVQGFVDFVWSQMKPGYELLVETKVYLDFIHPTEAFGTVDVAIIEPFGVLHVIDFKYGQGYVNHKDNSQMLYYALGIAHLHHYDFEKVKTTIYQPRGSAEVDPAKIARTDEFSVEKLKTWRHRFEEAVIVAERILETENFHEDKELHAGSWCKFCPAKILCPAITKTALQNAKLDFASPIQPEPQSLTTDQLKKILDRAAYLELWVKEVKKYAEDQIRAGKKIPGYGLVPTKPSRVWKDDKTVEMIREKFPQLVRQEVMTPAQAEKYFKEGGKKSWASMYPKQLERFIKDNVVTVSSGDKLSQTTNDFDDTGLDDLIVD